MNNPLSKTVMVTGATSGIGKATATLFAKRGYNLIITGRRKEKLELLKQKFKERYKVLGILLTFLKRYIDRRLSKSVIYI